MDKFPLSSLIVRPVFRDEVTRWDHLMRTHHYLGFKWLGGHSLRYIGILGNRWVALIGWNSAAKNCGSRERYIGWSGAKKYRRLIYVANNSRFLILPGVSRKNLASKVLSLNLKRLSEDYERIHGHPVYLAETFVDESRFQGTCYKASNWKHVGYTKGYARINRSYYHHGAVKAVYIYELYSQSREILSGTLIPHDVRLLREKRRLITMIHFPIENLLEKVREFEDPRSRQGRRHSLETVLAIALCAVLCGCRGYRAIGTWAASLTREELIRFGSIGNEPPSEPTIRRVIQRLDANKFDKFMYKWLLGQKLLSDSFQMEGAAIAIDGKTVKGSHNGKKKAIHLLSALIHKEGIVIAQDAVDEKTNEIKHVFPLLDDLDIEKAVVTADALHTQKEIADYLVEKKKADYVFCVKGNQPTLLSDITDLDLKKTHPTHAPLIKHMEE
jgi:predicted transposase YbfD/YdcC